LLSFMFLFSSFQLSLLPPLSPPWLSRRRSAAAAAAAASP